MKRVVLCVFAGTLVFLFIMAGWTTSVAHMVVSQPNYKTKTEPIQDSAISFVSGEASIGVPTVLYEGSSSSAYVDVLLDFSSKDPVNVTIYGVTFSLISSTGQLQDIPEVIGTDPIEMSFVHASQIHFTGYVRLSPVMIPGNFSLSFYIDYWVYTDNQTFDSGWGDRSLLPMTIVPSVLEPEGWIYANAACLTIGIIILARYSIKWMLKEKG